MSERCVIGEYCRDHQIVHGAEAEELRERFEELESVSPPRIAQKIRAILDDVDARDSLAYLQSKKATDGVDVEALPEL